MKGLAVVVVVEVVDNFAVHSPEILSRVILDMLAKVLDGLVELIVVVANEIDRHNTVESLFLALVFSVLGNEGDRTDRQHEEEQQGS